jgi:predicted NUDIX family NTP pyrophosphohydrolase
MRSSWTGMQFIRAPVDSEIRSMRVPKQSAGLLIYRRLHGKLEVFLVHPGGPFWSRKDRHAWSIPKGEYDDGEAPLEAAKRECREETGFAVEGTFQDLGTVRQSGKVVRAWACAGDYDPEALVSNTFTLTWPPGSGKEQEFPEVDRAAWFPLATARQKIHKSQEIFLDRLEQLL